MKLITASPRWLRYKGVLRMRWILFVLICATGNAWPSNPIHPQADGRKQGPQAEQKGTDQYPFIISGEVTTKKSQQEAENDATASKEKAVIDEALVKYTGRTALFTFLLFSAAVVQAGLFVWQLILMRRSTKDAGDAARAAEKAAVAAEHSIQVSREAYIASERPWISVDAAISTDLVKKPEGIEFGVNFTVKNHGGSPAINVHIFYEVVSLKIEGDQFSGTRQKITDRGVQAKAGREMGIQLFPSDIKVIRWKSILSIKEIENAPKAHTPPNGLLPSFYVVGAVFYQSAFDEEIHQTGFNYYVCAIGDPRYPKGSDVPDFVDTFPMERIILDPVPYYKGTID